MVVISVPFMSKREAKLAKRFPIKLPPWHEKRLIWWAFCKGASKTGLAQNTLQARVEANAQQIEDMLKDISADRGIALDDLKQEILDGANFSFEDPDDQPQGD